MVDRLLLLFQFQFLQVPYESLGPELSDSYEERSRIFYVAKLCNMAGRRSAAPAQHAPTAAESDSCRPCLLPHNLTGAPSAACTFVGSRRAELQWAGTGLPESPAPRAPLELRGFQKLPHTPSRRCHMLCQS